MFSLKSTVFALLATSVGVSFAVPQIDIQGPNFVTQDKKRFKIVGVDYQPGGQAEFKGGKDPLSDSKTCLRDAALMQQLGINTVRVYNLDQTISHDECMSIFNEAGIYMILDVNTPFSSLQSKDTAKSYNTKYLERVFGIVENFKNYDNTLGFFGSNEVMNDLATAKVAPPFIRAVIRDLKMYIKAQADRPLWVGYSAADVRPILKDSWEYFQCTLGEGDMSQSDFFALNSYSWCGDSSLQKSGYSDLQSWFSKSAIPVFFSEYGCNQVPGARPFTEVPVIYGNQMESLSGGLVYLYTEEADHFGLVDIENDGTAKLLQDFDNLQKQYNTLTQTQIAGESLYNVGNTAPKCSASLIENQSFNSNFNLPKAPSGVADFIKNGISPDAYYAGKMVDVSDLTSSLSAVGSGGQKISDLKVTALGDGDINTPSGADTSADKSGNVNGVTAGNGGASGGSSGDDTGAATTTVVALSSGLLTVMAVAFNLL